MLRMIYFLKALFVAITALAIAGTPVVASLKLCCCSKPAEGKKSCCRTNQVATLRAQKSCCAKKLASNGVDLQLSNGCCCIKALESTNVSGRWVRLDVEKQSLDLAFLNEDQQRKVLNLRDVEDQSPGRFSPSGPLLLAHYCRWLK
jgi:hypothetical protein